MTVDWWTLGLQTVNVVILIWLLQRFFWKPIAAMIAERRHAAQSALADAQAARATAQASLAEIEKTRAGFAQEREKILAEARSEAQSASAARAVEAIQQATAVVDAARTRVTDDATAAAKAWASRSSDLAMTIAGRLATRLDGPVVRGAFLDWALNAIRALPAHTRQAVGASGAVHATTATRLEAAEQIHAEQSIDEAFGAPVKISFEIDPLLIAGLEIRADHLAVGNSWRADLVTIRTELALDN